MIPRSTWRSWYIQVRQTKSLNYILAVVIALLGAAHIYFRTSNYGPNITGDTLTYISVAENLAAGNGFLTYNQFRFQAWPPFFPIILALFEPLGIDLVDAGRFIGIIGFGLILGIFYGWLSRYLKNPILIAAATAAIVLSYPLNLVSSYLLTETIFIIFSLLALIKLSSFLQSSNPSRSDLKWAASFTALATTTRYLGVALILTGIFTVMIRSGFSTMREKFRYIALYTAISSIPLGIWFYRNFLTIGYITGIRTTRDTSFTDRLSEVYDVLYQWVWFDSSKNIFQILVVIVIVIWTLIGLSALRKSSNSISRPFSGWGSSFKTHARWKVALPFGLFLIIYLAIVLIGTSVAAGSGGVTQIIDTRYMAPIYIPTLIVIVVWLDYLLQQATGKLRVISWATICLLLFVLLNSIAISLQRNIEETSEALADDTKIDLWGYSSDSETMEYLRDNPLNGQMYSNEYPAIYWFVVSDTSSSSTPEYVLSIPEYTDRESCLSWIKSLASSSHTLKGLTSPHNRAYIVYFHENRLMSCPIPEFTPEYVPELLPYIDGVDQTSEATIYQITESSILDFNVQVNDKTITYTKKPCNSENTDISARFLLHIVPVDKSHLLVDNPLDNPFHTMDFDFADHGIMSRNECIIRLGLPQYDISEIYTGQFNSGGVMWETTITPSTYGESYDIGGSETVTSVPGTPSRFSAIGGNGWIILSWDDPGDPSITHYQIREQTSYDRDWWCWSILPGSKRTVHRIDWLPQGTTFRIQLRAQNAAGTSPTTEVLVSTADPSSPVSAPDAPAGLSGIPGNESIMLNWEDPNDSTIVDYQTRELSAYDAGWRCWRRRGPSPGASISMSGLSNDLLYQIQLRALNAAGASPVSQISATPTSVPADP